MTKDIAIYGAGSLGREVACLIRQINELEPAWNLIGFFDIKYLTSDHAWAEWKSSMPGRKSWL